MDYVISIDQGTSSTRSLLINSEGKLVNSFQKEHKQIYPKTAWVEHNPLEIKENVLLTLNKVINESKINLVDIKSIGITNQRETIVAWDKTNGQPLGNAIVWQCRRTADMIDQLKKDGYADLFHEKTGLVLDAYFSGTKMKWLLDNNDKVRSKAKQNELAFGTIDSWLIYCLTGEFVTDNSNASRTLLYNLKTNDWDNELLEILKIPKETLPSIKNNGKNSCYGDFLKEGKKIEINGVLGDQQSALFGQLGFDKGSLKTTYGTGNFTLFNTGNEIKYSNNGLLTTVAWNLDGYMNYALEGSVFVTGAATTWLRDGIQLINAYGEIDKLASKSDNSNGVFFVPAFVGLGAPYWDASARGLIIGISSNTNKSHLIHATLDAIAAQTQDLLSIMEQDTSIKIDQMHVDGGLTQSEILMQKQANLSQIQIRIPSNIETTALGAALIAGYGNIWSSLDDLKELNPNNRIYSPNMTKNQSTIYMERWKKAVKRAQAWI